MLPDRIGSCASDQLRDSSLMAASESALCNDSLSDCPRRGIGSALSDLPVRLAENAVGSMNFHCYNREAGAEQLSVSCSAWT